MRHRRLLRLCSFLAVAHCTRGLSIPDAESRAASAARTQFTETLASNRPRAFDLAICLAAEERTEDEVDRIRQTIDAQIETLAESARVRMRLAALVGTGPATEDPRAVATAVATTLFGSRAPDDNDAGFFAGSTQANYYDPSNSFLDQVLDRRVGIPITLSLVYTEVCERLGLPMVGLNAPSHLLVAPADVSLPFVVDPFDGGTILSFDEAATLVARNAGFSADVATGGRFLDSGDERGRVLLTSLRTRPMTACMWCARMLRNLRAIHANANDVACTLGAAERLRLVGQAEPAATSASEQAACARQIGYCVYALRWRERREEARTLLQEALRADDGGDTDAQIMGLLDDAWWSESL